MNGKISGSPPRFYTFLIFFVLAVLAFFSRCELYGKVGEGDANMEGALPLLLPGEWVFPLAAPDEVYTITDTRITYTSASDPAFSYEGRIEFVSNYRSNSGLIIIKYTDTGKPTFPAYNGKDFFAVYYRNLNSGWVQLANTTILPPPASTSPEVDSLEEAKEKFTRMTMGKYVDWAVVQPQRRIR
jgi:hypothetical protein